MGQTLTSFSSSADFTDSFGTIELTSSTLHSVVLYSTLRSLDSAECFGEICISTTPDKIDQRSAVLVSGYFGGITSLSWIGSLPTFPNLYLVAFVASLYVRTMTIQIIYTPISGLRSANVSK